MSLLYPYQPAFKFKFIFFQNNIYYLNKAGTWTIFTPEQGGCQSFWSQPQGQQGGQRWLQYASAGKGDKHSDTRTCLTDSDVDPDWSYPDPGQ